MRFSVGYQLPDAYDTTVELVEDYRKHISSVYFAASGEASARASIDERNSQQMKRELREIREMGISTVLLFNANCYGEGAVSDEFAEKIKMYLFLEIIGTIAFAISGAMVAIQKKMDALGVVILGITTAIGGGIVRDIIIGTTPPTSLTNPLYAGIAFIISIIVFIPFVRKNVNVDNILLIIIDAIGLGTFTVIGIKTAATLNNVFLQIFLGVLTGVGGGVMRDIFAAEKPIIFVKKFYALASLVGAIVCVIIYPINKNIGMITGIIVVVILRILAAKLKWNLPRAN